MEMIKMSDKRVRIITKGPKDMDTQIDIDETVEEVDPFDNKITVGETTPIFNCTDKTVSENLTYISSIFIHNHLDKSRTWT